MAWKLGMFSIPSSSEQAGKLTTDTQTSVSHTTRTILKIIININICYVIFYSYVLQGKFQTDQLEARFGRLRKKMVIIFYEEEKKK